MQSACQSRELTVHDGCSQHTNPFRTGCCAAEEAVREKRCYLRTNVAGRHHQRWHVATAPRPRTDSSSRNRRIAGRSCGRAILVPVLTGISPARFQMLSHLHPDTLDAVADSRRQRAVLTTDDGGRLISRIPEVMAVCANACVMQFLWGRSIKKQQSGHHIFFSSSRFGRQSRC